MSIKMDVWILLVSILAGPLASSRTGSQSTTTSSSSSSSSSVINITTSTTELTNPHTDTTTTTLSITTFITADVPFTTTFTALPTASESTTVTPEITNTTTVPDNTNVTSKSTNSTTVPDGTTVTPESSTATIVTGNTTVTSESTNSTTVPDGTTVTPEMTNSTTVPEGTTVNSTSPKPTPSKTTLPPSSPPTLMTSTTSMPTTTTRTMPTTTAIQTTTIPVLTSTSAIPLTTTTTTTTTEPTTSDFTTTTPVLPTTTTTATTADFTTTTAIRTTTIPVLTTTTSIPTTTSADFNTTTADPTTTTAIQTTTIPVLTTTSAGTTTTAAEPTTADPTTITALQTTTIPLLTTTSAIPPPPPILTTTAAGTTTTAEPNTTTTTAEPTTTAPTTTISATPSSTTTPVLTTTADFTATTLVITTTTATTVIQTTIIPVLTTTSPIPTTTSADFTTTTDIPNTTTDNLTSTTAIPTTTTAIHTTTTPVLTSTSANSPPPPTTTTTSTMPTTTTMTTTTTTTPSTTSTPSSTTPLVCLNGGVLVSGVCVCPDEWSGTTCSVGNFCEAKVLDGFRFPSTPVGWFAYSTEICPKGTSSAGKPQASTRCSIKNGSPSFDRPPQILQCDQTLSDIQQNLTSAADLETLASSTQILTSRPEELTAENVTAAAQIVNTLLLSPNATESVRVAAVATVSQLLNASVPDNTEENNATLSLTLTLDQLSVNLSSSLNASQSQVVQPNLVVQSAQIPAADTQGVQFTSLTGTSGSFVAKRIQLNTNASSIVVENGFIADALIYVRFPPAATSRQQPSNVSLGFVLYQNDHFFRSRLYRRRWASVRVLSASVRGQERSMVPQQVEMMFRPTVMNGTSLYDFACVFWNFSLEDWSTVGCSKVKASDGVLRCFCNHTTNFAALWSFREKYEYAEALGVISIVGLSVSIVGLIITIIHHIKVKFQGKSREHQSINSTLTLLCIYVSLLAFIITFLSGVNNPSRQDDAQAEVSQANIIPDSDEHIDPDRGSCTAVAALLHFFLLATFMWNSVYGTQLLLLVWTLHRNLPSYWTPVSVALGWGVPAVVMAITLGATYKVQNPLGYRQEEFCWLAGLSKDKLFHFGKPMFWGFLLPVGLILIYNIVLLVLVSLTTCRTDPKLTSTHQRSIKKKFLTSFSLAVILGLSWTLGYLVLVSTGHLHLVFSIVFCLCTTTQGFQIFILFTARTPSFRATVSRSVQYVSSVNIPLRTIKYSFTQHWDTSSRTESYRDLKDQNTSKNL